MVFISMHHILVSLEAPQRWGSDWLLTQGPEGSLLGHQGEETGLEGVCDDDVKQLLKVLPATTVSERTQCEKWLAARTMTAGRRPNSSEKLTLTTSRADDKDDDGGQA